MVILWHPCENLLLEPLFLRVNTFEPLGVQILLGIYFVGVFNNYANALEISEIRKRAQLRCILVHVHSMRCGEMERHVAGEETETHD